LGLKTLCQQHRYASQKIAMLKVAIEKLARVGPPESIQRRLKTEIPRHNQRGNIDVI
jgi:hypothetical protein